MKLGSPLPEVAGLRYYPARHLVMLRAHFDKSPVASAPKFLEALMGGQTWCPVVKVVTSDDLFDQRFRGRLRQIFLYITDECNIRCAQCYYKPMLAKRNAEMPTDTALALLGKFRELGAVKVTLLGGEPTLYGKVRSNLSFPEFVGAVRRLGFEYIRVVTNGLFPAEILQHSDFKNIDEVTFSMDGDTPEIHEELRGRNTFSRSVNNLRLAVALGYKVHVTMCAHRGNIGLDERGELLLIRAIKWAEKMGARAFNFHPLFQMGVPRDNWTGETHIEPDQWLSAYREIRKAATSGEFSIHVRLPLRFCTPSEFETRPTFFGYCSVKQADRLDVHRNGQIHTCALHNGTPISVARFLDDATQLTIMWERANNELAHNCFDDRVAHPCAVMKGISGSLLPLCISLKPDQDEFIWNRYGFH